MCLFFINYYLEKKSDTQYNLTFGKYFANIQVNDDDVVWFYLFMYNILFKRYFTIISPSQCYWEIIVTTFSEKNATRHWPCSVLKKSTHSRLKKVKVTFVRELILSDCIEKVEVKRFVWCLQQQIMKQMYRKSIK